mmetsp:Transcript_35047/g.82715  ORF Transcript_35047/g.82715 Transcript_35047/m.82715 type:complete len:238 (+) Transcript_35047:79-792(+)
MLSVLSSCAIAPTPPPPEPIMARPRPAASKPQRHQSVEEASLRTSASAAGSSGGIATACFSESTEAFRWLPPPLSVTLTMRCPMRMLAPWRPLACLCTSPPNIAPSSAVTASTVTSSLVVTLSSSQWKGSKAAVMSPRSVEISALRITPMASPMNEMATNLTATVALVVISFWSMVSVVRTRPKKMLSCVSSSRSSLTPPPPLPTTRSAAAPSDSALRLASTQSVGVLLSRTSAIRC